MGTWGCGDKEIWDNGDRGTALGLPLLGVHCALLCLTGTLGLAVTYCCRGEEENTMMAIAQKCNLQLLPLPGGLCAGGAAGLGAFLIELHTGPGGLMWLLCWGCFAFSPRSSHSAPDKCCLS